MTVDGDNIPIKSKEELFSDIDTKEGAIEIPEYLFCAYLYNDIQAWPGEWKAQLFYSHKPHKDSLEVRVLFTYNDQVLRADTEVLNVNDERGYLVLTRNLAERIVEEAEVTIRSGLAEFSQE